MCDNKEIQELIASNARLYGQCLKEVINFIPRKMKATSETEVTIEVSDEMYKDITTTIFIETHRNIAKLEKVDEPASDAQKGFIVGLLTKKGKRGEAWMEKYLEFNKLKNCEQLTKEQASDVITELKKL